MSKVTEFVDVVRELHDTLVERELVYPAEVVGAWASTIFINSNRPAQPPSAVKQADKPAPGATRTVSGKLEIKKDPEKKTGKNGKPFTVYALKVNGEWLNTTDAKALSGGPFSVGEELMVELVANNQGYWNITSISKDGATSDEDIPW